MLNTSITVISESIVLAFVLFHLLQWLTQKSDEPLAVENAIPFIGPVVQMLRCKSQFHLRMRNKYGLPVHTLRLPWIRIYVLNELSLITAAQKQHHILSFGPIMGQAIGKIAGTSDATNKAIIKDALTDDGFLLGFNKAIHHTMAPGPSLDMLTRRAASTFLDLIDELKNSTTRTYKVSLSAWMRSTILRGTTDAVYGPRNPFRDPAIETAWYAFEPGVTRLAMRFIPSFATKKTRQARQVLVRSFTSYFSLGCPEEASDFMKARYNHIIRHQITNVQDIAKLEVAGAFSIITNSAPTAFWLLYHIFSDKSLLADCRLELDSLVHERDGMCYLNIGAIKTSCPTLHSTLHEVMRYYGVAQSLRAVLKDHKLENTHLLRKDSLVMMPATVQHFDPSIWGFEASQFNHKRFTKSSSDGAGYEFDSKTCNRGGFRGFGGGLHLCPGRHFAVDEILTFAALIVLRFDIEPTGNEGWPVIHTDTLSSKGSAIIIPDNDLEVILCPREDKKWAISSITPS
ncbi:cytochrome P450 [Clohesyomyces aquaticus]|uniref:Cytochrome P450 n=1 Tax=Clohesyomyces aquaticus TaxID=1231657 RepID=A0A1Y1Z980_9PLEO|nr:cytochrome P450 [Clohesyomyces aquaticus]